MLCWVPERPPRESRCLLRCSVVHVPAAPSVDQCQCQTTEEIIGIEWLRERTEHLDIFLFFRPSLNGVLFPMFCLLVEGEFQILVF